MWPASGSYVCHYRRRSDPDTVFVASSPVFQIDNPGGLESAVLIVIIAASVVGCLLLVAAASLGVYCTYKKQEASTEVISRSEMSLIQFRW